MFAIPAILLAIAFGLAAAVQMRRKHWEQVFTRLLLAAFYLLLFAIPDLDIVIARALARYFILLLALVEVLTFAMMRHVSRRRHDRS